MIWRSKLKLVALTITSLLVISTFTPQTTRGQENPKTGKEQRKELEKKTVALLNEVASAAWSLKLPENRFFITASAADLLWAFDEKRARALYADALNSINAVSPAPAATTEAPSKTEQDKLARSYFTIFRMRQNLLRKIARRDPQLALEMLRATRQVSLRELGFETSFADDRELEQEIASEVAARDPAQALQLARQTLAKGLTYDLLNILYQLNQKDSEKASQFAGDIITKLETTNVGRDVRASLIALQLLEASRKPDANRAAMLVSAENTKILSLSEDQRRELVEILTDAALSGSANSNLLSEISDVMPEIEHFFPERTPALDRKLATFNETLNKQRREQNTFNTLIRRGMSEDLIRTASGQPDAARMMLYQQAAIIAVARGNTDAFRDFVGKEVGDSSDRRKILDFLDEEEINTAAGRKQLEQLRKLLPKIGLKEERARAMAELAVMLKEKGEDEEAESLLDEAASLIKTDLKDDRQINALMGLLCASP